MRATEVLQKCLGGALEAVHSLRQHVLLRTVEAVVVGRRLTLFDIARSWPGAERIRAPLKALDRLLSNPHMHAGTRDARGQSHFPDSSKTSKQLQQGAMVRPRGRLSR
jgi:hypothetical protein